MNALDEDRITKLLDFNSAICVLDSTVSTNDVAKSKGGIVFARTQTGGKGRSGRSFFSGEGGLYFSLALKLVGDRVEFANKRTLFSAGKLTVSAGIAVVKALEFYGVHAELKWVNDVYVCGKKVCGILAERTEDRVVIGIGINVNNVIPPELDFKAASLKLDVDMSECAARVLNAFYAEFDCPDMDFCNCRCLTIGKRVSTPAGTFTALMVDEDGALIVKDGNCARRIFSGEAVVLD